jgi:regulator of protease activity HflC (stomatin/prohibitin superfamily)
MTNAPRPLPDGVEDDLGAAATLPGKRGDDGGGSSGPPRRRRRRGGKLALAAAATAILVLALVPAVTSTLAKTPRDKIGISYGGGPIEGAHFQKIVEPGSSLFFNGLFDDLYLYPADQRNYIVSATDTDGDNPGAGAITAPTRDHVQVGYQVAVYYRLNTDLLREFHEELGLKYSAYTTDGWNQLIEDTFRQQIETALQEQTRRYDVSDLFGNVDVLIDLQQAVEESVSAGLVESLGADFFCSPTYEPGGECGSPTVVVKKIDIPTSVAKSFENVRISQDDIERRTNEAEAIRVLSDALAEAGDDYNLLKAIESGNITFWVLPDGGVTIAAPDDAAPPGTAADGGGATTTPPAGSGGG